MNINNVLRKNGNYTNDKLKELKKKIKMIHTISGAFSKHPETIIETSPTIKESEWKGYNTFNW